MQFMVTWGDVSQSKKRCISPQARTSSFEDLLRGVLRAQQCVQSFQNLGTGRSPVCFLRILCKGAIARLGSLQPLQIDIHWTRADVQLAQHADTSLHELVVVWPDNFFFDLGWSYALSIVASSLPQQEFGRAIIESNISDNSTGGCASGVAGKEYWKLGYKQGAITRAVLQVLEEGKSWRDF